jgi:hypothetical protein
VVLIRQLRAIHPPGYEPLGRALARASLPSCTERLERKYTYSGIELGYIILKEASFHWLARERGEAVQEERERSNHGENLC